MTPQRSGFSARLRGSNLDDESHPQREGGRARYREREGGRPRTETRGRAARERDRVRAVANSKAESDDINYILSSDGNESSAEHAGI